MKTYVIAEAGVNHNGNIETAKRIIDAAKRAGVSCIKFETFIAEELVSRYAQKAEYQKRAFAGTGNDQLSMLRKFEIDKTMHLELIEYCDKVGIEFLSTPFDMPSIELLDELGIGKWKIPSGEITNLPYLRRLSRSDKTIILSTGMSTMDEIRQAVTVLRSGGNKDISLMHCNTQYPTPYEDVNLRAMQTMRAEFGLPVGYSDHTLGIEVSVAAVAMGAVIIEKHFTLDKEMEGPDHHMSVDERQLTELVTMIQHVEQAFGNGEKIPSESEKPNMAIARKSIIASRDIKQGEKYSESNLTTKRPGNGISPMEWDNVMGKTAKRDFNEDELIEL